MDRILRTVLIGLLALVMTVLTLWCALALWYRLPAPETVRLIAAGGAGLAGIICIAALFGPRRLAGLGLFTLLYAGTAIWWATITPPGTGNWRPDVARQTTGDIDGDILTLKDVRAFDWQGPDAFTEAWVTRRYDLSALKGSDLFMSYWGDPLMAHMILSFGFADGRHLAWSVEVRRRLDSGWSPIADFFKEHTLSIIAAEEHDVVGVRANVRDEDVQLFRLRAGPDVARKLIEEYVRDANRLAREPAFYNSIFTNCTTVVFKMMAAVGDRLPLDWRVIANGYLPDYAYDMGALNSNFSIEDLRQLGRIAPRAKTAGLGLAFSTAIREGVPEP